MNKSSFFRRLLIVIALFIAAMIIFVVPAFAQDGTAGSVLYSRESVFSLGAMTFIILAICAVLKRFIGLSANVVSIIALVLSLLFSIGHQVAIAKEPEVVLAILLVIANTFVIFTSTYGTNEFLAPRPGTASSNNLLTSWRNPSGSSIG